MTRSIDTAEQIFNTFHFLKHNFIKTGPALPTKQFIKYDDH